MRGLVDVTIFRPPVISSVEILGIGSFSVEERFLGAVPGCAVLHDEVGGAFLGKGGVFLLNTVETDKWPFLKLLVLV